MAGASLRLRSRLLLLLFAATAVTAQRLLPADCSADKDCGTNSTCSVLSMCDCGGSSFSATGSNTDCRLLTDPDPRCNQYDEDCVYCGPTYQGPCRRCSDLIRTQDSRCTDTCEDGTMEIRLLPEINRTARLCITSASFPLWAIVVIIAVAVVVLVLVVAGLIGVLCYLERPSRGQFDIDMTGTPTGTIRTRRSNSFSYSNKVKSKSEDADTSLVHENHLYIDDNDEFEGDEETFFKMKLVHLRKEAEVFLKMLNDMRRRSKELPPDSPVAEQYNNVMRDVTRVLYLVNKKKVQMPIDGVQLVKWAENVLRRYVASQDKEKSFEKDAVPSYMQGSAHHTEEFLEKLTYLRDYAETFLRMLNEMRRRLKELRPDTPTAQNYRAISKDVTRLLDLLNRRPSSIEIPFDGMDLLRNSERLLKNYLESQGVSMEYKKAERLSAFGAQDETDF